MINTSQELFEDLGLEFYEAYIKAKKENPEAKKFIAGIKPLPELGAWNKKNRLIMMNSHLWAEVHFYVDGSVNFAEITKTGKVFGNKVTILSDNLDLINRDLKLEATRIIRHLDKLMTEAFKEKYGL